MTQAHTPQAHTVPSQAAAPGTEAVVDPVEATSERVFTAVVEGMDVLVAAIGDRLGYYAALDGRQLTPDELAEATHTSARYAREWLEHQAVAGYTELTPGPGEHGHVYRLAPGVAEVLARPGTLTSLAPLARQLASAAGQWTRIAEGARTGSGLGWAAYGPDMRESQADMNAPQLRELLAATWLPAALPELHRRMTEGEQVRVADVGCGGGWAAIALASAFPSVTVDAYDVDPPTVALARANVAAAGHGDRVRVVEGDVARAAAGAEYDLVMAFECIHDLPAPVEVLTAVRRMLRPGARALIADMAGAEELRADADPVQRALYGFSLLVCLPDAMSGGADQDATGTVMRPSKMTRYARSAGFSEIEVLPIAHDFWRFYLFTP